jgi:Skp family chaperone for outer membrane proteins
MRSAGVAMAVCLLLATGTAGAADLKIGVVDMKLITERSTVIQAMIRKAEGPILDQRDKIEARRREFEQQRGNLAARRSVMSPEDAAAEEARLRTVGEEIADLEYEVGKQYSRLEEEVMRPAIEKIIGTIRTVAVREAYDLILPSEMALYSSERADITPLVIEAIDKGATAAKP